MQQSLSHRAARLTFSLVALTYLAPQLLFAQDFSPRVFVIFDTSGSMLWSYESQGAVNCQGDGSQAHPHRGTCTNQLGSRLYHAKDALTRVVNSTNNVEFGLMRYGQLEPGDPNYGDLQQQVGAQYLDASGNISSINYDGSSNGCGPADLLVSPSMASEAELLSWLDGVENYPSNKELRANGYTPLTHSLESAKQAVITEISTDPVAECRSYYVLLMTDGYQQCPNQDAGDPATRTLVSNELSLSAESLRNLNINGNEFDVRTFVVGFGPGTQFATELDELARSGGTAIDTQGALDLQNGMAYQANDPQALINTLTAAISNARPRERCDGVDNDCDGLVDEDFQSLGSVCRIGIGECNAAGVVQCSLDGDSVECSATPIPPQAEVCDDVDNDCDGRTDEGTLNQCGACGGAQAEVCDGGDNDCDGVVDEGTLNACGRCGRLPEEVCNSVDDDCDGRIDEGTLNACGGCGEVPVEFCDCNDNDCDGVVDEGLNCPDCNCQASAESCDGQDNDCDGYVDEGLRNACNQCGPALPELCNNLDEDCDGFVDEDVPGIGMPCGNDVGACQAGVYACVDGQVVCNGASEPLTEICDGVDNDCDGRAEEGAVNACGICGPAMNEFCDNIDNDCDGEDDTRDLCGEGFTCLNGECTSPCMQGECTNGMVCLEGVCSTPCRNRDCASGWVCQNGECIDPCVGVSCLNGSYCSLGRCIPDDCYGVECSAGQICVQGACVSDPCASAGCGPQQGCVDGRCFEDCDNVRCPEGSTCVNGECSSDPCLRINCGHASVCVDGTCQSDPCFEFECGVGFICEGGGCIEDPCNRTTCPQGDSCHRGICSSSNPSLPVAGSDGSGNEEPIDPVSTAPSQGCDCDQREGTGPLPLWLLLWLPLYALTRRARAEAQA